MFRDDSFYSNSEVLYVSSRLAASLLPHVGHEVLNGLLPSLCDLSVDIITESRKAANIASSQ